MLFLQKNHLPIHPAKPIQYLLAKMEPKNWADEEDEEEFQVPLALFLLASLPLRAITHASTMTGLGEVRRFSSQVEQSHCGKRCSRKSGIFSKCKGSKGEQDNLCRMFMY